jgi:hypothetical protein
VSYDHAIHFGPDVFPRDAYDAFVANSLRTLGTWRQQTHTPFELGRDRALHDYLICDPPPGEPVIPDWEKGVGVRVGLRRGDPADPEFGGFPYYVRVETGAGRSPLSMAVQFLVVASAFQFLPGTVVVDDHSEDPENAVTYTRRDDFARHAARVLPLLYDWNQLADRVTLDRLQAELQRTT